MRKTILIALAFMILMFVLAFAADSSVKKSIYSFNPSFKAEVDYDLNDYKAIAGNISKIIWTCSSKKADCMTDAVKEVTDFDFYFKNRGKIISLKDAKDWNTYCEAQDEDFFYDFAEFYDNCINSLGSVCKCELDLSRHGSGTKIDSALESDRLVLTLASKGISEDVYLNGFQAEAPKIESKGQKLVLVKNSTSKKMYFDDKTTITEECRVSNKYFKACAVSKKTVLAQSPITGNTGEQNIVTRFAFRMLDLPPPPISNVQTFDEKRASNKLIVKWNESEAVDAAKYAIYYSNSDFISQNITECAIQKTCNKKEIDLVPALINSIKLDQDPLFDEGVYNYFYDGISKKLADGKLYQVKSEAENYYFYILEVPENINYYIAVTAIDSEGKEIDNVRENQRLSRDVNYVEAKSEDDIATGKVTKLTMPTPPDYELGWTAPEKNIDYSLLDPNSKIEYVVFGVDKIGSLAELTTTSNNYLILTPAEYADYSGYKILPVKSKIYGKESPERDYLLK